MAMFIYKVNGTEIKFELKLRKYSKTLRRLILVKVRFYKIKKKKKRKTKSCTSRRPIFAIFLTAYFH